MTKKSEREVFCEKCQSRREFFALRPRAFLQQVLVTAGKLFQNADFSGLFLLWPED